MAPRFQQAQETAGCAISHADHRHPPVLGMASVIRSQPIEIGGRLVAVAVLSSVDWHLVAIDPRIADLHGVRFRSAEDATEAARFVLARESGQPAAAAGPLRTPHARGDV